MRHTALLTPDAKLAEHQKWFSEQSCDVVYKDGHWRAECADTIPCLKPPVQRLDALRVVPQSHPAEQPAAKPEPPLPASSV